TVTVTSAVLTGIAITPATSTLAVKATEQLTATGTYSDGTTLDLTRQVAWKTTNKKIVSIRQNGVATGVKKGSATISATKNGVLGTATVTVP
ncbi:MAG TPA: Ig-like domain-containing protein, partial [Kofleriaceae bacterium]|nr:Ig-like domain-containing protein [Kofleriaceae bacterium]